MKLSFIWVPLGRSRTLFPVRAVRYPVGFEYRHNCLLSLAGDDHDTLKPFNYVDSRKVVYVPLYLELVKEQPLFDQLKEKLDAGINLLIVPKWRLSRRGHPRVNQEPRFLIYP